MDICVDLSNTVLNTKRLEIRPWQKTDLYDFYEYARVPGVGEAAGWRHHESIGVTEAVLNKFIEGKNEFALVLKAKGKVIGSMGLHYSWAETDPLYGNLRQKEIGYVLSKDYWGIGLMTEAVVKVIGYCFGTLGLEALTVGHFASNDRSRRVIEKCGFVFVKKGIYHAKQLGLEIESWKYILLNQIPFESNGV